MDDIKQLMMREHVLGSAIHNAYMTRTKETEVGPCLRDKAMEWIWVLNSFLELSPESFALAVHILDTFLFTVKVKVNYLRCVSITAYFLSIKTVEEHEDIPPISELLQASECGCCKADILKMEKIILLTLKWKLHIATPVTFLHQMYQLFVTHVTDFKNISGNVLMKAEEKLQECLCKWEMTQFRSSVLSLAVLELKLQETLDRKTLLEVRNIRQMTKVDSSELDRCQLLITAYHDVNRKNSLFKIPLQQVTETTLTTLAQRDFKCKTTKTCLATGDGVALVCKFCYVCECVCRPKDKTVTILQEETLR